MTTSEQASVFEFTELVADLLDQMEKASKQIHAERFTPRG